MSSTIPSTTHSSNEHHDETPLNFAQPHNPHPQQQDDMIDDVGEDEPLLHIVDKKKIKQQYKFVARNNHVQILADRMSIALGIEAFGAFALSGVRTLIGNNPNGLIVLGVVYTFFIVFGAHHSGCHLNPAMSFAYYWRGKINARIAILYSIIHYIFAFLGSVLMYYLVTRPEFAESDYGHAHITLLTQPHVKIWQSWFYEFFYTFWLIFFYLTKTTTFMSRNSTFYYIYMGAYMCCAMSISGTINPGLLNPAIAIGNALPAAREFGLANLKQLWVYLLAHYVAGFLAPISFNFMSPNDIKREWREHGNYNLHGRPY